MSKKQREKVEEEVNFHQSQNRMRGNSGSGTSPDPWTNPDSTAQGDIFQPGFGYNQGLEQGPGPYTTPNHNPFFNQGQQQQQTQQPQQQQQPGGGSTFDEFDVDSTTPNPTPFDRNGGNLQETDSQHIPPGIHNLQLRLQISVSISKKIIEFELGKVSKKKCRIFRTFQNPPTPLAVWKKIKITLSKNHF